MFLVSKLLLKRKTVPYYCTQKHFFCPIRLFFVLLCLSIRLDAKSSKRFTLKRKKKY